MQEINMEDSKQELLHNDPELERWLQKLREMHRPEEEEVLLEM